MTEDTEGGVLPNLRDVDLRDLAKNEGTPDALKRAAAKAVSDVEHSGDALSAFQSFTS